MGAGAVPVAADGLRVERRVHAEVLGDAVEQPARHPQVVGDGRRADGADLELPLAGHHLAVGAGDREARGEAGVGVRFDDLAAEDLVGADAAVVRTLRRREAVVRPAERLRALEEGVLLLDAEPGVVRGVLLRRLGAGGARVGLVRLSCRCSRTSFSTSLFLPPRIGSGQMNTGFSTQSELLPGAWLVLEPSKPQMGGASPSGTILVLLRSLAVGSVPSIQMYSAL